ncbi:MAG: heavy-metal-associated domain-containing protein [Actinobacteria bacterium]|nr:heavy-metal-associated domain-containing protein [Actinomycetota bacterium]MCG2790978.1 heavy-metal-associated domain-containing protein [Actinomycetes bacterium]
MARVKETYPVLGMTCASCVRKIETVLNKTNGVTEATVNFATEKVTIEYDNDKLNLDEIKKIIKSIGYELIT